MCWTIFCKILKDKAVQNRQFAENFPERQFAKKCSRRTMFKIYKSWSTTTNSQKNVSRYECGLRSSRCLLGPVIFSSRANLCCPCWLCCCCQCNFCCGRLCRRSTRSLFSKMSRHLCASRNPQAFHSIGCNIICLLFHYGYFLMDLLQWIIMYRINNLTYQ